MLWRVKLREKHAAAAAAAAAEGAGPARGYHGDGDAVAASSASTAHVRRPHGASAAPHHRRDVAGTGGASSAGSRAAESAVSHKTQSRSKKWLLDAVAMQRAANPKVQVDEAQRLRAIALYRMQQKQKKTKGREAGRRLAGS